MALLNHFGETPNFKNCGRCDNCVAAKAYAGDMERDFGPEALALLTAVQAATGSGGRTSWTHIERALTAGALFKQLAPRRSAKVLKEFVPALLQKGLAQRQTVKGEHAAYDVYGLTTKGSAAISNLRGSSPKPLMLPVPASVRADDAKKKQQAAARRAEVEKKAAELRCKGVNVPLVPESELQWDAKSNPVSNAILHYARTLSSWRERGQDKRADAHEALLEELYAWRQREAERLSMAPAAIFADHLAMKFVIVKPSDTAALAEVCA